MSALRIVGVDPGFANIGLCVVDVYPIGSSDIVATQLIVTKPSKGKAKNITDEKRRLEEIEDTFVKFITEHKPEVLAMEEPGKCLMKRQGQWVTNPATLRTSCLMWGAAHGVCRSQGIYCVMVGAQQIKKAVCNKKTASKSDIIEEIKRRYPTYNGWPTSKKVEHIADAVGATIASFSDPTVMIMLKRLSAEA